MDMQERCREWRPAWNLGWLLGYVLPQGQIDKVSQRQKAIQTLDMRLSPSRFPRKSNCPVGLCDRSCWYAINRDRGGSALGHGAAVAIHGMGRLRRLRRYSCIILSRGESSLLFITNTFTCIIHMLLSDKHSHLFSTLSRSQEACWTTGLLVKCALVAQE
jgi:hypothetical protein